MSQEITSIIINHNGFLVWGPKGPKNKNKNNKNNNFALCMTMPQAAGKKGFTFHRVRSNHFSRVLNLLPGNFNFHTLCRLSCSEAHESSLWDKGLLMRLLRAFFFRLSFQ